MEPHNGAALVDADISDDGFICAGLQNGSALLMDFHDIKVGPLLDFLRPNRMRLTHEQIKTECSASDLV
jgi:hypothetical protein